MTFDDVMLPLDQFEKFVCQPETKKAGNILLSKFLHSIDSPPFSTLFSTQILA